MAEHFDTVVIGAGAAGMQCAAIAGQRGKRVLLVDHASTIGEKIRISGGGRSNFTNLHTTHANFLSANPHFCRSALARYTPQDFLALLKAHGVRYHEKHRGQLFCDHSAQQLIDMLRDECAQGGVKWRNPVKVKVVRKERIDDIEQFVIGLETPDGAPAGLVQAHHLVVATGGLSIPKIGATDWGYRLAKQFGLTVLPTRPALVPLTFSQWPFTGLAGVALPVEVAAHGPYGRATFSEDLLFTHKGLSGPAVLQISSHWDEAAAPREAITINLLPGEALNERILSERGSQSTVNRALCGTWLSNALSKRLSEAWIDENKLQDLSAKRMADLSKADITALGRAVNEWAVTPDGTEGYRKAEVTAGGVSTRELSSQTMQANAVPGLYFIGEVVDVTGHLGGFNFQWAWASGAAAANAM
jgi:predicted Rossmann fold flavoprotein